MFVCVFLYLRVRRDIYTYLRFELRFEVWVGWEMGDGVVEEEGEEGKGGHGKDGIRSISLSFSLSRYAMICSIVDFCTM